MQRHIKIHMQGRGGGETTVDANRRERKLCSHKTELGRFFESLSFRNNEEAYSFHIQTVGTTHRYDYLHGWSDQESEAETLVVVASTTYPCQRAYKSYFTMGRSRLEITIQLQKNLKGHKVLSGFQKSHGGRPRSSSSWCIRRREVTYIPANVALLNSRNSEVQQIIGLTQRQD